MAIASVYMTIEGMDCGGCATAIAMLTENIPGVQTIRVEYKEKSGFWSYDDQVTSASAVMKELSRYGYLGKEVE